MTETTTELPVEVSITETIRFNALKHGVLSYHTVLPWEVVNESPRSRASACRRDRSRSI
jgi:hypothetical protein